MRQSVRPAARVSAAWPSRWPAWRDVVARRTDYGRHGERIGSNVLVAGCVARGVASRRLCVLWGTAQYRLRWILSGTFVGGAATGRRHARTLAPPSGIECVLHVLVSR